MCIKKIDKTQNVKRVRLNKYGMGYGWKATPMKWQDPDRVPHRCNFDVPCVIEAKEIYSLGWGEWLGRKCNICNSFITCKKVGSGDKVYTADGDDGFISNINIEKFSDLPVIEMDVKRVGKYQFENCRFKKIRFNNPRV